MPEHQRRHIAVSPGERRQLEEGKRRYEDRAGHTLIMACQLAMPI
ncbi:MAG: hypothetical protein SU899_01910 [Chloroflexota bacterium]|nr:hypothetical protein [Chloroflexota bacterium]